MLVSALMATFNRRQFVPRAIRCFLDQSYQDKELVIVDDGDDPVGDIVPDDPRIRYLRCHERTGLREKRDATARGARGDIMVLWDDDDWHGPERIARQVAMLAQSGKGACLLDPIVFHEVEKNRSWRWSSKGKYHMCVGTLAFTRSYYELVGGGFPARRACPSDQQFVRDRPWDQVVYADGEGQYIAVRHSANTSDCTFVHGGPWSRTESVKPVLDASG